MEKTTYISSAVKKENQKRKTLQIKKVNDFFLNR